MTAEGGPRAPGDRPPLLSVVLPVAGVEEYLGDCLDSVLGQAGPAGQAIEVIAVEDASGDRCAEILDARAAQDKRLRVIHLGTAVGPGPARNLGLAEAAGEYVWFVDPDDLLAAGALGAVAARLRQDQPDLLLVDYLLLHPSGRTEPSPGAGLLRAANTSATVTLAGRPELLARTMTAWSKVFRRSFLTGLGVDFLPGIHEDIPVSAVALLSARRIGLLDQVCYLYRQRARSFLATPGMSHFSVFGSYARVFAFLEEDRGPAGRPVTAAVRCAVFGRAMEHYTTILGAGLVPRPARRDYFRRAARDFQRYRPPGYRHPPGWRGLKMRLVERDAYLAYSVLGPLNGLRVWLRDGVRQALRPAGSGLIPTIWGKPPPRGQKGA